MGLCTKHINCCFLFVDFYRIICHIPYKNFQRPPGRYLIIHCEGGPIKKKTHIIIKTNISIESQTMKLNTVILSLLPKLFLLLSVDVKSL